MQGVDTYLVGLHVTTLSAKTGGLFQLIVVNDVGKSIFFVKLLYKAQQNNSASSVTLNNFIVLALLICKFLKLGVK
jgi:hypothetical protein